MERLVIMREECYRAVREDQHQYYAMAPPKEDPAKFMLEHFGKRAEQKAFAHHDYRQQNNYYQQQDGGYEGPYLHATVVHQQQCSQPPPMAHKVQTSLAHHDQTVCHHKRRYPQTSSPHDQGHVRQQQNIGNQVLPPKKHGAVMDCNEVAKLYGGVVFIDYDRNKYPVRA